MADSKVFIRDKEYGATTGGVSTAYTLSILGFGAYEDLKSFNVKFHVTNGSNATLNINSLGAKPLVDQNNTALPTSLLDTDGVYIFAYNVTNDRFVYVNSTASQGDPGTLVGETIKTPKSGLLHFSTSFDYIPQYDGSATLEIHHGFTNAIKSKGVGNASQTITATLLLGGATFDGVPVVIGSNLYASVKPSGTDTHIFRIPITSDISIAGNRTDVFTVTNVFGTNLGGCDGSSFFFYTNVFSAATTFSQRTNLVGTPVANMSCFLSSFSGWTNIAGLDVENKYLWRGASFEFAYTNNIGANLYTDGNQFGWFDNTNNKSTLCVYNDKIWILDPDDNIMQSIIS